MAITGAFQLGGGIAAANRLVYAALQDAGYMVDIFALNESNSSTVGNANRYRFFGNNKLRFTAAVWRSLISRRYTFVFAIM